MAVNVTLVPEQMVVDGDAAMLTLAVTFAFKVIEMELDVAGLPFTQVAFEVIAQVIASLLFKALSEYVVEFIPTLVPFFFH